MAEDKEREKRINNVIIVGLESTKQYSCEDIRNWLKQEIEVEVNIEKVWKVRAMEKILLCAQCGNTKDKREVMINKKKLGERDIYIENDLTWTERNIRDRAWDKAIELKKNGSKAMVVGLRKVKTYEGTWIWSERKGKWFLDKDTKLRDLKEDRVNGEENK